MHGDEIKFDFCTIQHTRFEVLTALNN